MLNINKKTPFNKNLKLSPKIFKKSIYPKGTIINESISRHKLLSIIQNSEDVMYSEQHPQHETYKSVHDQLKKYDGLYDPSNECFNVKLNASNHGWGRINPDRQLGLSVFHRPHRHSLVKDIYDDYDMINAEPEIFNQVLKLNNATNPSLEYYCANRDTLSTELSEYYKLPKDKLKTFILSMMNGGELSTFVREYNLVGCEHHNFILQFSTDIKATIDLIYSHNTHIGDDFIKSNPKKFKGLSNADLTKQIKRTVASMFFLTIERHIQEIAINFLVQNKGVSLIDDVVPSQDGFMLKKECSYPELISDIQNAVLNEVGFPMRFKKKPFDEAFEFELIPDFNKPNVNAEAIDLMCDDIDDITELEQLALNSDYDIAKAISKKYGSEFTCACIKNNIWYQFVGHRWVELECASSLHLLLPEEFRAFIKSKVDKLHTLISQLSSNEETKLKKLTRICQGLTEIAMRLGRTNDIKNIMTQLKVILHDATFFSKLDPPKLLCCLNGVIDFNTQTFRHGKKEDYCTKSTNINFITSDEAINPKDREDLFTFIEQLIPYSELRVYLLQHLASALIGDCKNELMFHYVGVGSNGKTKLIALIQLIFGEYYGTMPITLICDKRGKIGGVSPEVADLRGIRYVAMQEPSQSDVINEGIMKQLTGGDLLTGRGLYKPPITFKPQFHLVACANYFLNTKSNDEGTWRRNAVITFSSCFLDPASEKYEKDNELHFPINKDLGSILKRVKEVLLRVLVLIAFETNGNITECEMVNNDSKNYRLSQDRIGQFINENIIPNPDECTSRISVISCANTWFEENFKYKIQNRELLTRIEKTYPCSKSGVFKGFILKMFVNEDIVELTNEEVFVNEFGRYYEITGDKTDFIPSINISEWAKNHNLKINTAKTFNLLLLPLGLDVKNKEQYRYKKIEGKAIMCWFGVKRREIPLAIPLKPDTVENISYDIDDYC